MNSSSIIKEMEESKTWDEGFVALTKALEVLMDRVPTADEVERYIYGDEEEREAFLNTKV